MNFEAWLTEAWGLDLSAGYSARCHAEARRPLERSHRKWQFTAIALAAITTFLIVIHARFDSGWIAGALLGAKLSCGMASTIIQGWLTVGKLSDRINEHRSLETSYRDVQSTIRSETSLVSAQIAKIRKKGGDGEFGDVDAITIHGLRTCQRLMDLVERSDLCVLDPELERRCQRAEYRSRFGVEEVSESREEIKGKPEEWPGFTAALHYYREVHARRRRIAETAEEAVV